MKPAAEHATEADVETQIIVPLFTWPEFLGIALDHVRSKSAIAARDIGKGVKRKIGYVPDFCITIQSLPIAVIEAKSPANDVEQAYAEARLYAAEINSGYPRDINPCCRIVATNGLTLLAGGWDSDPQIRVNVQDVEPSSQLMDQLRGLLGFECLQKVALTNSTSLRNTDFKRPFNQGAGTAQILSRIDPNTFAADLSPILRRYFSSRDQVSDSEIYGRAYISSNEMTSYDRILQSYLKDRLARSKARVEITTTKKKSDTISRTIAEFGERKPIGGELQLITGGVGVGKSLFARRYKEYLQPEQLQTKNHWAFLNFNSAPQDASLINSWVCEEFVKSLLEESAAIDLTIASDQERVFAANLVERKAFYDRMENVQAGRGELEKARDIEGWRQDSFKLAHGITRYLQGDRGENVIAVFDNVDRRDTAAQLAFFQTALWFMDQTRCLVILQMRDATFEAYKNEPPLDTYRTGQVFHISPPRFVDVVKKRLELSLETLASEAPELIRFQTQSGISISYPKSRAGDFLRGIYQELFVKPNNSSRVLESLAGRNVRRALDMFLAIITSGHMPEETITSVAQGTGFRSFPEYRILRALMRQDYRYFSNDSGFIANIFHCDGQWKRPSNFVIPEILFYLIGQRKVRGDNGQMGFVAMPRLLQELSALGFVEDDVHDAAVFCLKKAMIECETSSTDRIKNQDCIKATASGWAHMRLLSARVEYLASVLPTTPINDLAFASRVFDVMQTENRFGRPQFSQYVSLVQSFEKYLRAQQKALMVHPGYHDLKMSGSAYVLSKIQTSLTFARREDAKTTGQADWLDG